MVLQNPRDSAPKNFNDSIVHATESVTQTWVPENCRQYLRPSFVLWLRKVMQTSTGQLYLICMFLRRRSDFVMDVVGSTSRIPLLATNLLKVYRALSLLKQHVSRFKGVFKMFKHGYGKIMLILCFIRKYTSTSAKWESNLKHMERQSIALRIYNVAVDFTTVVVNVIVESIAISIYQDIWPADREQLFYSVF